MKKVSVPFLCHADLEYAAAVQELMEENNININFSVRICCRHSCPLRPDAQWVKKLSPHHRDRRKTREKRYEKIMKTTTPGRAPKIKKNTGKFENAHFRAIVVLFLYICVFGERPGGGFRGLRGFSTLYQDRGITICVDFWPIKKSPQKASLLSGKN